MSHKVEYDNAMISTLELIWGEGFMAPGGEGHVTKMVEGLNVQEKLLLDIGSGLGGPAFFLASNFGAHVIGIDIEADLVSIARKRAAELNLDDDVEFQLVEPGTLNFPDESFDIVFVSGMFASSPSRGDAHMLRLDENRWGLQRGYA